MNLLKLRFNQMKIVQQPLCSRRDVLPTLRDGRHIVIRLAQCRNVLLHAREKRRPTCMSRTVAQGLRCSQAAPVLLKTLRAKQLGPNQWLGLPGACMEYFSSVGAQLYAGF